MTGYTVWPIELGFGNDGDKNLVFLISQNGLRTPEIDQKAVHCAHLPIQYQLM